MAGRIAEFDLLRAAAIAGVVLIHATSPFVAERAAAERTGTASFLWLLLINQAARFSVPAFFLLSGFFAAPGARRALERPGGVLLWLRARLGRLLVPYLTWSAAFLIAPRLLHGSLDPADAAARLALGWTFTGAYFLIALAQLTLAAPILVRFADRRPRGARAACGLLAAAACGAYLLAAHPPSGLAVPFADGYSALLSFGPIWSSFYLAGILLERGRERVLPILARHRGRWLLGAGALLLLSIQEAGTALARGVPAGLAAGFFKPSSMLFAAAATAAVLAFGSEPRRIRGSEPSRFAGFVRWVAGGSYAVYLVHGAIILAALGIGAPAWQALLRTPWGPPALALPALLLPLAVFGVVERRFPAWARFALFGLSLSGPACDT